MNNVPIAAFLDTVGADESSGEITVKRISEWFGWSRWTAWRWLSKLEQDYGDKVVSRMPDGTMFTTRQGLTKAAATVQPPIDTRVSRRLMDLEEKVQQQQELINGLSREVIEFRRKARDWFRTHDHGHRIEKSVVHARNRP